MTPDISSQLHGNLEFREAALPVLRSDTALLFVHGMGHQANSYDQAMNHFSAEEGMRCLSISLEGHGGSPLNHTRSSINELSIADYNASIRDALEFLAAHSSRVVIVCHSLSGRCGYELAYDRSLPEQVKGVVLLAPVPAQGTAVSALNTTFMDMVRSGRLTPLSFPYALLVTRDIETFLKSDPDRAMSIFFSDDRGASSHLSGIPPQEFMNRYLCGESTRALYQIMLPSWQRAHFNAPPVLIIGAQDDRIILPGALRRMRYSIARADGQVSLSMLDGVSHDIPMDVGQHAAWETISHWMRSI